MIHRILDGAVAALLIAVCVCASQAGKFNKVLDIGSPAPAWNKLAGADGKAHSLGDLSAAKAVVVVFTCNHCPVAQAYEDRLLKLHADHRVRGLELVAISVSELEEDNLAAMTERAKERGFTFQYLQDPTQQIAKDYGATNTPHVFLLDGQRKIAYMGAIDDAWQDAEAVSHKYLVDAVEAVLAGQAVERPETKPQGCGIEYK